MGKCSPTHWTEGKGRHMDLPIGGANLLVCMCVCVCVCVCVGRQVPKESVGNLSGGLGKWERPCNLRESKWKGGPMGPLRN